MAKGRKTGGGSRLGRPNKVTADIKDMIHAALDRAGGVDYLVTQAHANPGPFMALLGKTLPKDINATIKHSVEQMSDDELRAIILRGRGGMAAARSGEAESSAVH